MKAYHFNAFATELDKPEITWDVPESDRLYLTMASLFELKQRYQENKHESEPCST